VQNFDSGKPDLLQKVQLEHQRSWRVFLLNVGEYLVSVRFALKASQEFAISLLRQLLRRRDRTLDEIEHPLGATGIDGLDELQRRHRRT
jgi:hypothetical protein